MKHIAYLESKTNDLENRGRRKNLQLFGLREGAEGGQPLLEFIQDKLPHWLQLDAGRIFTLERAHRTLAVQSLTRIEPFSSDS
ncbi:G2/mitotic-specific cyclin-B3 [Dissostichus eleginoides]|uniref:G2/mitotic-specific cyclin-B3 n=1 Tax=Dissostichus eleginoides TaxID=100907 RepID=A0AAD9BE97_DISEL|nr:G2/mitotic-specific cyclin-B3 [Dissostichus eleginoides]